MGPRKCKNLGQGPLDGRALLVSALADMALPKTRDDKGKSGPAASKSLRPLKMIAREAAKYPLQIALAVIALVVTAMITSLALPTAAKLIVDRGFGGEGDVGRWFRYLLLLVSILGLGTAMRFYFVSWVGERVVADVRCKVYENLLRLSPSFFEKNSPREISSRMTADTAVIEQVVGTTVSVALRNSIMAVFGTAYLFWLAPQLAVWLLAGIPLVIVPIALFGRRLRDISRSSQDRVADVGGITTEILSAMKIVQGFNQEEREAGRFGDAVARAFATARIRILVRAVMTAMLITLIFGALTILMWRGATMVNEGTITGGTISAFVLAGAITAGAFGSLTEVFGDLLRGAGAAGRLSELLEERPEIVAPARPQPLPEPARGSLSFEKVTFSYPTRPAESAISDFALVVEPGESVAIVGPSGAGKSTIFQLVERFYDPQEGRIKLDGVALTQVDPRQIRQRMAIVPQEGILFAASARDNLRYGAWDADEDAIWEAARVANAEDFLRALPNGLDTFLGEGGARLSGGQRQRMAIARALLRDAPILLLDEATSALDAESERLVQDALEHLMQDRTTLVIAHRLATVRAADRIVVMEDGRIVETGDHNSLSAAGGLYSRLAALQFDDAAMERTQTD